MFFFYVFLLRFYLFISSVVKIYPYSSSLSFRSDVDR